MLHRRARPKCWLCDCVACVINQLTSLQMSKTYLYLHTFVIVCSDCSMPTLELPRATFAIAESPKCSHLPAPSGIRYRRCAGSVKSQGPRPVLSLWIYPGLMEKRGRQKKYPSWCVDIATDP